MDIDKLDNVLEALLFVSGQGLRLNDIADVLELQKSELDKAVKRLKVKYSAPCGVNLVSYNGKVQFGSNPDYAAEVMRILNPIREKALSNACLETAAIIAYRQPVTRLEIESVRGVDSDYAVSVLVKNNLVEVVGRKDAVGKPLLFGTTDEFLKRFRIESIAQLPDYDKLLESLRLISEAERGENRGEGSVSLYNEFVIKEEEKPEFLEGEEIVVVSGQ
ncbi:MAG: SMC-Scp complex subunit ScpB [Firmicutes bacterium]|nr:SMC-Scp complex subunit ScpB [Bacillota bacterium]